MLFIYFNLLNGWFSTINFRKTNMMACRKSKPAKHRSNVYIDIEDTCRVCMKKGETMTNLFHPDSKLVEEIQFCTGILITENAILPSAICQDCLTQLSVAQNFKTTCITTENIYQELLQNLKIEIKNEMSQVNENNEILVKEEIQTYDDNNDLKDCFDVTELEIKKSPKKTKVKKTKCRKEEGKFRKLYCVKCDLPFETKQESQKHYRLLHKHDWVCEICGKQFVHQASHYSHMRAHAAPQHACAHCDYRTAHKSDLTKHVRVHTGEKKYQCHFCTGAFRTSSNLAGHITRNHGGHKGHSCDKCDKKFFTRHKLNQHLDSHNNIKRFECDLCHSCFTRRCHWRAHLQKQHAVITPRMRPGRRKENSLVPDMSLNK